MKHPAVVTLRTISSFHDLSDQSLEKIAKNCEMRSYRPNMLVMSQNSPAKSVGFIVSGFIKLMRGDRQTPTKRSEEACESDGKRVLVDLLGPGESFGAASALLGNGYSSSAISLTPCDVAFINADTFTSLLYEIEGLSKNLMQSLAKSLIESEKHAQLMNGDVKTRVFSIRNRCSKLGIDPDRWLSNAEVARMAGATRVAVSQVMNRERRTNNEQA